ncbi:MAG: hypothetical protein PHV59_03720, partial [Victivallales bacterium]|nr:hypothetical protein [Victivallales bacterium]
MKGIVEKIIFCLLLLQAVCLPVSALDLDFDLGKKSALEELRDIKADNWNIVGKNIIVKGHVYIPYGKFAVFADKAVVNIETKDFEAIGNIRIYELQKKAATVTMEQLSELSSFPQTSVNILDYKIDPTGNRKVKVEVTYRGNMVKADKVSGNLASGFMKMVNLRARYNTFTMKAKRGTRHPGGKITIDDGEISSCSYLANDNAHYSVKCGSATLAPQQTTGFGISGGNPDFGDHSVWARNCSYNVYGIPILWLPFLYKPKDESLGLFQVRGGYNSNWGAFFLFSKRYKLTDSPYSAVR